MNRGLQSSHCRESLKNEDGCQNLNLQCSKRCNEYLHINASQKYRKEMIKRLQAALCFGLAQKKQPFPFKSTKSFNEKSRIGDQGLRWRDLLSYYRANAEKTAQEQDKQNTETQEIQKRYKEDNKELDNTIRRDEHRHYPYRKDDMKQQLFQSRLQQNQENSSVLKSHNCFGNIQWEQLVQHKSQLFGQSACLNESALNIQFENQQLQAKLRQHEQNIIYQQHLQRNIVRNKSSNQPKVAACSNRSSSLQSMNTPASFNQKQYYVSQQQSKQLCQNQFDQPCIQSPRITLSPKMAVQSRKAGEEKREQSKRNSDSYYQKQCACSDELESAHAGVKQEVNIKSVPSIIDLNILEDLVQKQIKNTLENLLSKERNGWEKALCEVKEQFTRRLSCMEETISQNSAAMKAINEKIQSFLEQNKQGSQNPSVKYLTGTPQSQERNESSRSCNLEEQQLLNIQENEKNLEFQTLPDSQNLTHIAMHQYKTSNNSCQMMPSIPVIEQLASQPILPGSTQPTTQSPLSNIEILRNTIPSYCPYLQASSSSCLKAAVSIIPMTHSFSSSESPDNMQEQSLISFQSSWMNQPLSAIHNCSADSMKPNDLYTCEQLWQQQYEKLPICNSAHSSSNPTQPAQTPLFCFDNFTDLSKQPNEFSQFLNQQSFSPKKSSGQLISVDSCQNKISSIVLPDTTAAETNLITPPIISHLPRDGSFREQPQQQLLNSPRNTYTHQLPVICEQDNEEEFILYQLDEKGNLLDENGKPVVDEIGGCVSFSEYQINRLRQYNILQEK